MSKKTKVSVSLQEKEISGIFRLYGVKNENKVKINHIENVKLQKNEHIADTVVKKIDIMKDVFAEISLCNIVDSFLMLTKKLPVMYISVIHEKPLRKILLFRIYVFFTITVDVTSSTQLLNDQLDGKFNLEISLEDTKKQLDDQLDKYSGDEEMYEMLTTLVLAPEMQELCKVLVGEINERLAEEYEKEFEYFKPPTNVISLKNYDLTK